MPEPTFYKLELEQDAYGSAVISLPDELCHDMALQPNERFYFEDDGDVITMKRLHAGYVIDQ